MFKMITSKVIHHKDLNHLLSYSKNLKKPSSL
jgi:hypothetical protein